MRIEETEKTTAIVLDKTEVVRSAFAQTLSLIIFSVICFAVPFLLGHPQLLVGSMVNAILVLTALNLKKYYLIPIVLLPSVAVVARGMVFGPFTIFLVYLMPLIWLGNLALVYGIKYFYLHRNLNQIFALGISILAKVAILFGSAFILVKIGLIPNIFLNAMGSLQLMTAAIGGVGALMINLLFRKIS